MAKKGEKDIEEFNKERLSDSPIIKKQSAMKS